MKSVEEQISGRFLLVHSAKISFLEQKSQDEWKKDPEPKQICREYGLPESLIEHVAVFVWTFRR